MNEQITLYFRQGSSDKVYQAKIEPQDGGYIVLFAYGRRGTTLQTGTKTQAPVPYQEARHIYEKLVKEKTAKGYTPGADGTPYQHTDREAQATGIACQLLNPVEGEAELESLLGDHGWWMQEKFDGRRLLIQKEGSEITGINRRGLIVALPQTLVQSARSIREDFLMDGEAVGEELHAFDLLELGGQDLRQQPYKRRYANLEMLLSYSGQEHLRAVISISLPEAKRRVFRQLRLQGSEGVVFKQAEALCGAGRPASGGTQRKWKFVESASFIVSRINEKRSVSLVLFDGEKVKGAGNVTIPPNVEIPGIGKVVEVRYLYAFRESGHIYQPVYLGVRDDIPTADCTTQQLKWKATAPEPEDEQQKGKAEEQEVMAV